MLRLRSRISVSQPDDQTIAVQSFLGRRILFGAIGALLLISFFVSVDWQGDFEDGMVAGTIFYFSVLAICLAVAGWNSMLVLSRSKDEARFIKKLFGIPLASASLPLHEITAVVIQGATLLKESERPTSMIATRLQRAAQQRNVYYKLYLETADKLHFVEDSTDLTDLEGAARGIAEFLGVTFRREEI